MGNKQQNISVDNMDADSQTLNDTANEKEAIPEHLSNQKMSLYHHS